MRMCGLCAFDRNDDDATRCKQCGADMEADDDDDDVDAETAWFHYLHIPAIGIIELVPGRAFQVGREPRNELVMPKASQDQVATFFWTEDYDEATLRSNGAREPVKIEGQFLPGEQTRSLKGGERITIGPLDMKYLRREERIENAIDARKAGGAPTNPNIEPTNPGLVRAKPRTAGAPQKRRVGGMPADIALALEKMQSSGTLRIDTGKIRGFVTVVRGAPRHAAYGRLNGREALRAILMLERCRLRMVPGIPGRGVGEKIEISFKQAVESLRPAQPARPPSARLPAQPGTSTARVPPQPGTSTARVPPKPGTSTARVPPKPGQPTPRPGAAPPRPGMPTPRPGAPPRPGMPTPRPGQTPPRRPPSI